MEIYGVITASAGLISVVEVCLKAAAVLEGLESFREDLTSIYAEYSFEQLRLKLWASHVLGITYSDSTALEISSLRLRETSLPSELTEDSPINLQAPLENALREVHRVLVKLQEILEKYGAGSGVSLLRRAGFQTRVYKEGGREEIQKLLTRLRIWNDRLEGIVESRTRDKLSRGLRVQVLSLAQTAQQLSLVQQAALNTHPALSREAEFRRDIRSIENRAATVVSELRVSADNLSPRFPQETVGMGLKQIGTLALYDASIPILQEWKFGQMNWGSNELSAAVDRAEKLAQMLHLENKPDGLRCLDLIKYAIKDTLQGDRSRLDFCFVYRLPRFASLGASRLCTLESVIAGPGPDKRRPTLNQKFEIAAALAESLLEFHIGEWLHKALCCRNVIFFSDPQTDRPNFSSPFVSGFEFSRPDTVRDQTLDGPVGAEFDVFCHPDLRQALDGSAVSSRPRYQRQYDVYGLGVILLELGCWMAMKPKLEKATVTNKHEELLKFCRNALPSRMGTKYQEVVNTCLTWPADIEKVAGQGTSEEELRRRRANQVEAFMLKVVGKLRECQCQT